MRTRAEVSAGGVVFRPGAAGPEVVLASRRTQRGELAWGLPKGQVEQDEHPEETAVREVREETGIDAGRIAQLYSLDLVASFLWQPLDAVLNSVYFALRVAPGVDPTLSDEHDAFEWLSIEEAIGRSAWPAYREALGRVRECLLDPDRAPWFELTLSREPTMPARERAVD